MGERDAVLRVIRNAAECERLVGSGLVSANGEAEHAEAVRIRRHVFDALDALPHRVLTKTATPPASAPAPKAEEQTAAPAPQTPDEVTARLTALEACVDALEKRKPRYIGDLHR